MTLPINKSCLGLFPRRWQPCIALQNEEIIITFGSTVIIRGSNRSMGLCDHEEADTRLIVHLQDVILNGCRNCLVRTVDTDVVVIIIGKFHHLQSLCPNVSIWIAFGAGKDFSYYCINTLYEHLFHSFTGCNTTSAFYGRGKKSAWESWNCFDDITQAFAYMALDVSIC